MIVSSKEHREITQELEEIKDIFKTSPKDSKAKNRLTKFFENLGDKDSELNKQMQGVGIAKKVISELIKLGEKLKDLLW